MTLSMTTREIVVDVVATDRRDNPLRDLVATDFRVYEISPHSQAVSQRMTAFRLVDPSVESKAKQPDTSTGIHVTLGGGCAEQTTAHYEISYQVSPNRLQSGQHEILITTGRRDAKLAFNPRYFVGETRPSLNLKPETEKEEDAALLEAACYHPEAPVTIPLQAYSVQNGEQDTAEYMVVVPAGSLPLISLSVDTRHIQLAYAACTFNVGGKALRFVRSSADRTLSLNEYVQAGERGFPSKIEIPNIGNPAFVRFVVRNPQNGNLGSVGIATSTALAPGQLTPAEAQQEENWHEQSRKHAAPNVANFPPMGPIGSFGSIERRPDSLCGDVYELPEGTRSLPNFWNLASVGAVHAYVLDVPHQQFWATGGIAGVTRKTDWFGIDYHGAFWVRVAGRYDFKLVVDDGAELYIDDELIIDADGAHNLIEKSRDVTLEAGRHTMHLPYFQGAQNAVALQLFVKPPGGPLEPFDLRNYAPPGQESAADH
jgi:hypothetical protein